MALVVSLFALALVGRAAGEAISITEADWDKEVTKRVEGGSFVFVKFLAPWWGHCKRLKPDWDKLAVHYNYKSNAYIADVDCTDDKAKPLCEKHGVEGFPTIKYYKASAPDGEKYEEGRDYNSLKKFVKKSSKKPCNPATLENCDKKEKTYIEEVKDKSKEDMASSLEEMDKEIKELETQEKEAGELFEKQKDEAMATMKKKEDLKKDLGKLRNKNGFKVHILKALQNPPAEEAKKEEL